MAITPICDSTLFDTYGKSPYVYLIDGDSTVNDLPTATDPKGFHCAISGEGAITSDNTMYMFFVEDGWKEIEGGGDGGSSDAVKFTEQTLTEAQQMQARKNQGLYFSEYEATAETVHTIEAKYIPAEIKLPPVSEADDGKILRVVDGAWAAAVIGNAEEASY